jgi:hypothetical protein
MITCQHARHLFDRYLDGELSPSLQAELHAHQLSCSSCQTELAMLEACGDVIMLDHRREPRLSDSFTDRVMLARRAQLSRRKARNWSRTILLIGSPMAAAASIVLALSLMWPTAQQQRPNTRIAKWTEAAPAPVQGVLGTEGMSPEAKRELGNTQQMPAANFMDALLTSIVERANQTVQGTQNNVSQLELLLQQALADTNARLAAQEQPNSRKPSTSDRPADRPAREQDLLTPSSPGPDSSTDGASDPLMDPL